MTRTIETWECAIGHQFEKPRGHTPETEPGAAQGAGVKAAADMTCPVCRKQAKMIHSRVAARG
jgi:hypothetical protein